MTDTRPFNPALFDDAAIDPETASLNAQIIELFSGQPEWWVMGTQASREARRRGEGPFPEPVFSDRARTITITGRDSNEIPLRVIAPAQPPRGIYLHLHGGGWVLGSADVQDPMLEQIADNTGQVVVAVEYRLAPEHPYPAGPDDCEAAADWLVQNGKKEFGTDVLTIGGESAGGHLSAVTILRMRDRHGYTGFRGANIVYGAFDLSMTPSQRLFGNTRLVLRTIDMQQFYNAFLPTITDRRVPDISPLYAETPNRTGIETATVTAVTPRLSWSSHRGKSFGLRIYRGPRLPNSTLPTVHLQSVAILIHCYDGARARGYTPRNDRAQLLNAET